MISCPPNNYTLVAPLAPQYISFMLLLFISHACLHKLPGSKNVLDNLNHSLSLTTDTPGHELCPLSGYSNKPPPPG